MFPALIHELSLVEEEEIQEVRKCPNRNQNCDTYAFKLSLDKAPGHLYFGGLHRWAIVKNCDVTRRFELDFGKIPLKTF